MFVLPLFLYKSGVRAAVWFQTRFYCPVPGRICQPLIVAVPMNADLPDCVRFGILKCFKQHLRRFDFCLADICPRRLSAAVWNARVALERRAIRRDRAEHPEELKKTRMSLEHSGQSFWIMHSDILSTFQQDFVYSKKKKVKPQISDLDLCFFFLYNAPLQPLFTTWVLRSAFWNFHNFSIYTPSLLIQPDSLWSGQNHPGFLLNQCYWTQCQQCRRRKQCQRTSHKHGTAYQSGWLPGFQKWKDISDFQSWDSPGNDQ